MNLLLATLDWYAALGVDEAVSETPWNRFDVPARAAAPAQPAVRPGAIGQPATAHPPATQPAPPPAPPPQDRPAAMPLSDAGLAAELDSLETLDALRERLERFEGCALKATAMHTVFGEGPADARLMIIGEAPGEEEDRKGRPFVGPSGQLLDRMLAAIGLAREEVYITNTIYWRPPGNRTPTQAEVQACQPFLRRQIAIIRPEVLLLVGGAAAKTMLQRNEGIMRLRGRWAEYDPGSGAPPIPAIATFHPAYLLRSPAQKREAWRDLLTVQERLLATHG